MRPSPYECEKWVPYLYIYQIQGRCESNVCRGSFRQWAASSRTKIVERFALRESFFTALKLVWQNLFLRGVRCYSELRCFSPQYLISALYGFALFVLENGDMIDNCEQGCTQDFSLGGSTEFCRALTMTKIAFGIKKNYVQYSLRTNFTCVGRIT